MNFVSEVARDWAVDAYKRGWGVIPLKGNNKTPNLPSGHEFLRRKPSKEEYENFAFSNYGIVCGSISGICVLDIDDTELDLGEMHIPPTWRVKTPRGIHYYFQYDPAVKTTVALGGKKGLDVRSDGSYVVGPGSVVDGSVYKWEMHPFAYEDCVELAEPPNWMKKSNRPDAYNLREPKAVKGGYIEEGERDNTLTSIAGYLHIKIHDVDKVHLLMQTLNDHYVRPPLSDEDVRRIVYGTKERYHENR